MTAPAEARAEWGRRLVAEYRSAAHAQELALWLVQLGASIDLVREAQVIAGQELDHAELSSEVLVAAGGVPGPVERADLSLRRIGALEIDALLAGVELFCVGETLAVPLFRRMVEGATVPVARRVLTRILRDEARHRRFGWDLLDALAGPGARGAAREALAAALPGMRVRVEAAYGRGGGAVTDEERAWGLIAGAEYADALRLTTLRWYRPRFAAIGLIW